MKKHLLLCTVLFFISSCSLAPFSSTNTGRSYGAGKTSFEVGNSASNYYLRLGHGLSENFDIGYLIEFGLFSTSGIFTKYSFLNNDTGLAIAAELGYGGAGKSEYWYLGSTVSYKLGKSLEFYLNPRWNQVNVDSDDYNLGDDLGGISFDSLDVNYLYLAMGMNVWFSQDMGLNLYVIKFAGENIVTEGSPFGASIIFGF